MKVFKQALALTLTTTLALPSIAIAAPGDDPSAMSDEERMETAKTLYGEAEGSFNEGNFSEALTKYEEAYNVYAPTLHVFNINIGMAAYELGDCAKAKTALQRFLDLVPDHPGRQSAQEKLIEIERSGCADAGPVAEEAAPITTPTTTAPIDEGEDAPILTSRHDEREEQADRERRERASKKASPMLIAGAVLTAVGGAALIGGAVSLGLANSKANNLADLASPGPTGFPDGDYADDEVFNLDRNQLPSNNNATIALFVGGGVLTAVGVSLIVVDIQRRKKGGSRPGDKNAKAPAPRRLAVNPTFLPGGGGAAASMRF